MDEPAVKRIKTEMHEWNNFNSIPIVVFKKILSHISKSDIKNGLLVNKHFNRVISGMYKSKTYLFIDKLEENDLESVLKIKRKFNEIFFHGNQENVTIRRILEKFGNGIQILSFGKADLNFMNVSYDEFAEWMKYLPNLTELNSLNIFTNHNSESGSISLPKLKKVKCYDSFLNFLTAPNVEEIDIIATDHLTKYEHQNVNNFLAKNERITKFNFKLFCNDEQHIQKPAFNLDHLTLTHLKFTGFRYDINVVTRIISQQKNSLVHLHLDQGSWSHENEMIQELGFQKLCNEILSLKNLDKLVITMPTADFLFKLQNHPKLTRLDLGDFPLGLIESLNVFENDHLKKLCLEGIDFGKKPLPIECIKVLATSLKNLSTLKIDTAPLSIMKEILTEMKNLKTLKLFRNTEIFHKMRGTIRDNNADDLPQTLLEKIIFEIEDKPRILPIIIKSPMLTHVKIYWNERASAIMTIFFDIIMISKSVKKIEFVHKGVYLKPGVIPFKSNFTTSYNNNHFEVTIDKTVGKIICCKIDNMREIY